MSEIEASYLPAVMHSSPGRVIITELDGSVTSSPVSIVHPPEAIPPSTVFHTRTHETSRWCGWHGGLVDGGDATIVDSEDPGSGPGRPTYACSRCVVEHGLLP